MNSQLINVGLYGDKPIRAEFIHCDRADSCPFYKNNTCLNVTSLFSDYCKFGSRSSVTGPRTKCASRTTFENKYRSTPEYRKLEHPSNFTLRVFDDFIVINLGRFAVEKRCFIMHEWKDTEEYHINDGFGEKLSWIPRADLTIELLKQIFTYRATNFFTHDENQNYKSKYLPNLCYDLKKYLPELYTEFIAKYPEFDLAPNHIGKYAKLITLNRECTYRDNYNHGTFHWEGDYLVCEDYNLTFNPFGGKNYYIKFKPDDTLTYKIASNEQVTDETEFM